MKEKATWSLCEKDSLVSDHVKGLVGWMIFINQEPLREDVFSVMTSKLKLFQRDSAFNHLRVISIIYINIMQGKRKMVMRLLVGLVFFFISTVQAADQQTPAFLDQVEGRWSLHKPDEDLCNDARYVHTIKVSQDREHLLFIKEKDALGNTQQGIAESTYKILYTGDNFAMLFLDGETVTLPTGDLVIWQLLLEEGQYRWRVYAMPTEWRNNVIGVRCS
ncbi:MAG: hypothetical protein L3J89_06325 [Gammaproteobacteria bacterium]|nr:hypothetical protein [Gammaproteobacteria bacterium]